MFRITIALYWKCIILKAQDKIFCNEYPKSTLAVSVDIFAKIRACFWCTWWFNKAYIFSKGKGGKEEGKFFLLYEAKQHTGFVLMSDGGKQLRGCSAGRALCTELSALQRGVLEGQGTPDPDKDQSWLWRENRWQAIHGDKGTTSPCLARTTSPSPEALGGWRGKVYLECSLSRSRDHNDLPKATHAPLSSYSRYFCKIKSQEHFLAVPGSWAGRDRSGAVLTARHVPTVQKWVILQKSTIDKNSFPKLEAPSVCLSFCRALVFSPSTTSQTDKNTCEYRLLPHHLPTGKNTAMLTKALIQWSFVPLGSFFSPRCCFLN